jgi:WD40 repeat protein
MREHSEPPAPPDSEALSRRQPDVQLEELWRQGQRPDVRDFLAGVSSLAGVVGVLAVDQRQRWQRGERVPAEEYLRLHPGLAADAEKALELIYGEFLLREARGETPDVEEYVRRFPAHATRLRQQLQLHRALAFSASQSDSSSVCGDATSGDGTPVAATSVPASAEADWPQVPGYEILGELGRGGMGVVYQARQVGLNRLVALKMLRLGEDASPDQLARFAREAEAVAQLQHAHIVQIHEVGCQDGRPYFALEYMDGGTLDKKLAGKPQPARLAAQLVETLARAMHTAHQHHIVHRDLKPANVLLSGGADTPLEQCTPKITDFGLAKRLDVDLGQTQSGVVMGTPAYMAPEQARGNSKEVGPAADVYALGAILYELLTGRPPFQGETALDTLQQVTTADPVPPRRLQPKVPRDLETVCLKCLEKESRRRYDSAEALAEDLRRFLAGAAIRARPVPAWERGWKWGRRRPAAAALIGTGALAVLGLVAGGVLFGTYERRRAEEFEGLRRDADERTKEAQNRLAENYLERGLALCEQGKEAHGVFWLHRALQATRADNPDLEQTIRGNLGGWSRQFHPLRAILPHRGAIPATAFGPDGQLLLTGSSDRTARLWRVGTGEPVGPPLRHDGVVRAVAFGPDGQTVLTGSEDWTARLWRVDTGQPRGPPLRHEGAVLSVAFSPDGQLVLTGSHDRTARLWQTATGKPLGPPLRHQGPVRAVAFNPDGQIVLTGSEDQMARLWRVSTGEPRGPPLRHQGRVWAAAFSPDGQLALTSCDDWTARLWQVDTGQPVGLPLRHDGAVRAVAFSPDGQLVLTGGDDRTARLWQAATGKPLGLPLRHGEWVRAVAFSPDGRTVLTGSLDRTARLWQVNSGRPVRWSLPRQEWVSAVAYSPDGKLVLTGCNDRTARLWQADTGQPRGSPLRHPEEVLAAAFSPDGQLVLTGCADRTARLWRADTGEPVGSPLRHDGAVRAAAFSPDGKLVLTGCDDRTARLWQVGTDRPLGPPLRHDEVVLSVALSPDGQTALTGCGDRTARLWRVDTGQPRGPPLRHDGIVLSVAFSPDGQLALTGSDDRTARLWRADTGEPWGPSFYHQDAVRAVAFSLDGKTVLTGSHDRTARLWQAATGKPLGPPLHHQNMVWAVAFSPDGRTVLTGSSGGAVQLWEVPQPLHDETGRIALGLSVLTGLELKKDERIHILDAETWQKYRRDLEARGNPLLP